MAKSEPDTSLNDNGLLIFFIQILYIIHIKSVIFSLPNLGKPKSSKPKMGKDLNNKIHKINPEVTVCFLQDGWLLIILINHLRAKILKT